MIETLTANEAAERLNVSVTTVKNWLNQMPGDKEIDSRGRRRIDEKTLSVLETMKALRDEDCGYETIRRRIFQVTDDQLSANSDLGLGDSQPTVSQQPVDTASIVAQVVEAMRGENELAEKYARVAHQVGKLEAENENLRAQLAEAKALLAAPVKPWWRIW